MEDDPSPSRPTRHVVLRAWKDVLVLASGTFCYNFGYVAFLFNLSSLYEDANLAFTTLSLTCAAQILTSLFLPALLVRKWGCKTTAILSGSSVSVFSAAQFYPSYLTFVPASIILGFGNTCLWVAVGTYVSSVGLELAKVQGKRPDVVLSTLFGALNLIRVSGAVVGNFIPYFLLTSQRQKEFTNTSTSSDLTRCGAFYCSEPINEWSNPSNGSLPAAQGQHISQERMAVFAVFLSVGLLGPILLMIFLNPRRNLEKDRHKPNSSIWKLLMATVYIIKDSKYLLLTTTFLNAGMIRAYATGDFSKGFILCSVGFKDVSLAAIVSNICYVAGTTGVSLLVRGVGMAGALTTTHVLCFLTLGGLLLWTPHAHAASTLLFVAAGNMGAIMGAYNNLNNTFIGLLFPLNKEEGYAAYRFHFALGSLVGFAWAVGVCMNIKIWTLIAIVNLAQGLYMVLEYLLRTNKLVIVSK